MVEFLYALISRFSSQRISRRKMVIVPFYNMKLRHILCDKDNIEIYLSVPVSLIAKERFPLITKLMFMKNPCSVFFFPPFLCCYFCFRAFFHLFLKRRPEYNLHDDENPQGGTISDNSYNGLWKGKLVRIQPIKNRFQGTHTKRGRDIILI